MRFNLFNLNYACLGAAFRFLDNVAPEVLLVEYNDYGVNQKRLPGGTVTFEDILNAINKVKEENTKYEESVFHTIIDQVRGIESSFKESINNYKERHEKNKFFGHKLDEVIATMESIKVDEDLIEKISYKSREETMTRKFILETNASEVGKLIPMSVYRLSNGHEKCGFVSVKVKAPDFYQGSGDGDIWLSHWKPVGEIYKKLFASKSAHHGNLLQSAMREAIEGNLHPRVSELKEYWTSTNPI